VWIRFTSKNNYGVRGLRAQLKQSVNTVVILSQFETGAKIKDDHYAWAQKVAKRYHSDVIKISSDYTANYTSQSVCGVFLRSEGVKTIHEAQCGSCKAARPTYVSAFIKPTETIKHNGVKTLVSVRELSDLSLQGIIDLMKKRIDEAMSIGGAFETAVIALENLEESEQKLRTLENDLEESRKAVRYFLNEKSQAKTETINAPR
jgi:hypothetical protein